MNLRKDLLRKRWQIVDSNHVEFKHTCKFFFFGILWLQAIAGLIYNTPLLLSVLDKLQFPNTNETVTAQFFSRWVNDHDCFFG